MLNLRLSSSSAVTTSLLSRSLCLIFESISFLSSSTSFFFRSNFLIKSSSYLLISILYFSLSIFKMVASFSSFVAIYNFFYFWACSFSAKSFSDMSSSSFSFFSVSCCSWFLWEVFCSLQYPCLSWSSFSWALIATFKASILPSFSMIIPFSFLLSSLSF